MNLNNKKEAVVCDLDGTLIEFPPHKFSELFWWRSLCSGFFSRLPTLLQIKLGCPTSHLDLIKDGNKDIFLVTGRKDTISSRKRVHALLNHFNIEISHISLKPPRERNIDYKVRVIKNIARDYQKVTILEDDERIREKVKEFGSVINPCR